MTNLPALREALECGFIAVVHIEAGEPDKARTWLDHGTIPAGRAFPPASRESFALTIVYGAITEAAAVAA
jgi:hypothetical protein